MKGLRNAQIKTLTETHAQLVELLANLGDRELDFRPTPGAWSIREILAHMVDDEMYVMRTRLERIVKEDRPHLAPHDESKWYASRNTTRDTPAELLADFALQRAASLGVVHFLRESDWQRTGFQPEYGEFTAEEWVGHWATHDMVHIEQIAANLRALRGEDLPSHQV